MRWKPNKKQKDAFRESMQKIEEDFPKRGTLKPLRKGCFVEFVRPDGGGDYDLISGEIITSSYGSDQGQHTFNIAGTLIKGRNLYPNIIKHIQGCQSKKDSR